MFERGEFALKVASGALLVLLLYRLGLAIVHINPLYHVAIPALPTLPAEEPSGMAGTGSSPASGSMKSPTNSPAASPVLAKETTPGRTTNSPATVGRPIPGGTNTLAHATNSPAGLTNVVASHATNSVQGTNTSVLATNAVSMLAERKSGAHPRAAGPPGMGMPPGGMPGMPGGPGKTAAPLAPEIVARIDRVIDSEILAPVMRPLPMALLGIAGKDVFLRAANGQTGLIKEGEELGGVKLIRIGVNRVLVEEKGQQKELTIFSGFGSDSLLSQKDSAK